MSYYILTKKVIILRKIQPTSKGTFAPLFFNYFSLSLNKKKCVIMRAMRKKLQKQIAARRYSSK